MINFIKHVYSSFVGCLNSIFVSSSNCELVSKRMFSPHFLLFASKNLQTDKKNMERADFAQGFEFAVPKRCSKYTKTLTGLAELVI